MGCLVSFRVWLDRLREVRGPRPLWPVLLGTALDAEFQRQRSIDDCYQGEVFIGRDHHPLEDGDREERLVARLYRSALAEDGCVQLGTLRAWLLGFQWPTQGGVREKKRQADLVGMTADGSIVVFEAKRADGEPPLIAIVEGLDYLACLLRPRNFAKIQTGFQKWTVAREWPRPKGFERTVPDSTLRPTLVVLAPDEYFVGRQARSIRGRDWPLLMDAGESMIASVRLMFAAADFRSPQLWEPASPGKGHSTT